MVTPALSRGVNEISAQMDITALVLWCLEAVTLPTLKQSGCADA